MYLPLLLRSPVQHAVTQQGSLLRTRDVEGWQLPVNRGVKRCPPCVVVYRRPSVLVVHLHPLPALVRVIIITVIVLALLSTSGPTYATTTTCAVTSAITCTGTIARSSHSTAATTGCRLLTWFAPAGAACAASCLLAYCGTILQLQTPTVRGVFVPVDGTRCPCFFWKLAMNSPILSVLQPSFSKAFFRARVKSWLIKKAVKDSVVVTWAGLVGRVR